MAKRQAPLEESAQAKRKRPRTDACTPESSFDSLPDDLAMLVLSSLARSATLPCHIANASLVGRRFRQLAATEQVLAQVSAPALAVPATRWPDAEAFVKRCAAASNLEARYLLGMAAFYLPPPDGVEAAEQRREGVALLVTAAKTGHAPALHSLSIIHFNGSGGQASDRNLAVGVLLCAGAARRGHPEALRELGHCLQDGYGIRRNVLEGRRLLLEANLREAALESAESAEVAGDAQGSQQESLATTAIRRLQEVLRAAKKARAAQHEALDPAISTTAAQVPSLPFLGAAAPLQTQEGRDVPATEHEVAAKLSDKEAAHEATVAAEADDGAQPMQHAHMSWHVRQLCETLGPLMSDFGCTLPRGAPHPANRLLCDHFVVHPLSGGLKLCSNTRCGRPETRCHEFRCCAVCSAPSYCSRACQALDWKAGHASTCSEILGQQRRREAEEHDALVQRLLQAQQQQQQQEAELAAIGSGL
eukprot:SM000165S02210  [mRNA]  locus=s165:281456:283163:+ [translate_table: standard]